ncbi:MAG: DUF2489 domain-containing protein [Candidatus Binatia bacterium]
MGMTTNAEVRDRAKVVEVAQAMLDGELGIIEGARRLNDLRATLEIYHLAEDFVGVVAIDSETDTLPIGESRTLWNEEALIQKDREVEEAERLYRDGALEDCRKLIARFGGPSHESDDQTE